MDTFQANREDFRPQSASDLRTRRNSESATLEASTSFESTVFGLKNMLNDYGSNADL